MFNKALALAKVAHAGQFDKGGKPYINHPTAVAAMVETEEEKTVALLHDMVEDTPVTLGELRKQGFPELVVDAVDVLTKRPDVGYEEYIQRVKQNQLALTVKIADITHNMDLTRIANPTERDLQRISRYGKILKELRLKKLNQ